MDWKFFFKELFLNSDLEKTENIEDFALMVAGGSFNIDKNIFYDIYKQASFVLACDRGLDILAKYQLAPDLILGDMDSSLDFNELKLNNDNKNFQLFPVRKNKTDSELGLDFLLEKKYKNVIFLAGRGSRLDHSIANFSFLHAFASKGMNVVMLGENYMATFLKNGKYRLPLPDSFFISEGKDINKETYVSFITFEDEVRVSLKGFDYDIPVTEVKSFSSLCISNHICNVDNLVSIYADGEKGLFLLYSLEND